MEQILTSWWKPKQETYFDRLCEFLALFDLLLIVKCISLNDANPSTNITTITTSLSKFLDILSNGKCTVTKTFGHLTCTFQFRGEQICQTNAKHKTGKSFFACCDVSLLLFFRVSLFVFSMERFIVVCGSKSNVKCQIFDR